MTNADLINTVQMYIRELRKHLPKDIKQTFTVACHTEMAKKLTGDITEGEWYTGAYQIDPVGNPLDLSYPYVVNICSTDHPAMSKTSIFTSVESEGEKETPTNPFAFANSNAQFGEYAKPRVFDEQLEERQFNNQIGKSMFPSMMLAESMSRLKAKAEKLKKLAQSKPKKDSATHSHRFGKDFEAAVDRVVAYAQKANEKKEMSEALKKKIAEEFDGRFAFMFGSKSKRDRKFIVEFIFDQMTENRKLRENGKNAQRAEQLKHCAFSSSFSSLRLHESGNWFFELDSITPLFCLHHRQLVDLLDIAETIEIEPTTQMQDMRAKCDDLKFYLEMLVVISLSGFMGRVKHKWNKIRDMASRIQISSHAIEPVFYHYSDTCVITPSYTAKPELLGEIEKVFTWAKSFPILPRGLTKESVDTVLKFISDVKPPSRTSLDTAMKEMHAADQSQRSNSPVLTKPVGPDTQMRSEYQFPVYEELPVSYSKNYLADSVPNEIWLTLLPEANISFRITLDKKCLIRSNGDCPKLYEIGLPDSGECTLYGVLLANIRSGKRNLPKPIYLAAVEFFFRSEIAIYRNTHKLDKGDPSIIALCQSTPDGKITITPNSPSLTYSMTEDPEVLKILVQIHLEIAEKAISLMPPNVTQV